MSMGALPVPVHSARWRSLALPRPSAPQEADQRLGELPGVGGVDGVRTASTTTSSLSAISSCERLPLTWNGTIASDVVEFDRLAVVGADVQAGYGSSLVSGPRSLTDHPTVCDRTH